MSNENPMHPTGSRPAYVVLDMCWCKKIGGVKGKHDRACARERKRRGLK